MTMTLVIIAAAEVIAMILEEDVSDDNHEELHI